MIEADHSEFLELLGDLWGAHSQNLKAHVAGGFWRGLKHMTLGEFRAVVEADIERLQGAERGVARPPTVAELWDLHRELKTANAAPGGTSSSEPAQPRFNGDAWSVNGNLLLLAHVTRDKPPDLDYAPDSRITNLGSLTHGEHTEAIAKILSRWMNCWVTDMREAAAEGSKVDGRANWQHCMQKADDQVREYLARYVRRQEAA